MVLTAVQVAPGTICRDACANTAESSSEVDLAKLTILTRVHTRQRWLTCAIRKMLAGATLHSQNQLPLG